VGLRGPGGAVADAINLSASRSRFTLTAGRIWSHRDRAFAENILLDHENSLYNKTHGRDRALSWFYAYSPCKTQEQRMSPLNSGHFPSEQRDGSSTLALCPGIQSINKAVLLFLHDRPKQRMSPSIPNTLYFRSKRAKTVIQLTLCSSELAKRRAVLT
jgi:hypothetical protein